MPPKFVGVAGLPRAGSTLLCQLLGEHPEISSEGHSSPLCNSLLALRRFISDDKFFLSQLDVQYDTTYCHLRTAMQGFMHGWYQDCSKPVVIDKNRGWLQVIELLLHLDSEARLLVPIRDLNQIYGSIEAQHQKSILIDFIDHLADYDRLGRAYQLFAQDKSIGAPLFSIKAVQDLPKSVKDRIYFVRFEDLVSNPTKTMSSIFTWLAVSPHIINPGKLTIRPHESDSHYRYKYLHRQQGTISPPKPHEVPQRIRELIANSCRWYKDMFYATE